VRGGALAGCPVCVPAREEIANGVLNRLGREISVRHVVDHHYGRQGAASEAGDPFYRERSRWIRVVILLNLQRAFERIDHARSPLDVTGRADAHPDAVLPGGGQAEVCIERADPGQLRRRDVADLGDPLHRLAGEIRIVLLDGLQ